MDLPVLPPLEPMLARLARELPAGEDYLYDPKWDGFRCLVFRDGDEVDLRSRNQRPLARYFPELVNGLLALRERRIVLDGEIVVTRNGAFDFVALLERLHPAASRVEQLSSESPAAFVAFDLLARDGDDLCGRGFEERRASLEDVLADARPPIFLTPLTDDAEVATGWLDRFSGGGLDGVMAKARALPYQPAKRAMLKVKRERTADCVVGGFRWHHDGATVGSLLLGLHADDGALRHVGLASSFTAARRRELLEVVRPLIAPLEGHPWEHGFGLRASPVGRLPGAASRWAYGHELTWVPLQPTLVCEVGYDHLEGERFRHPARFRRWRPDRDPRSCTYEQFEDGERPALADLLPLAP